MMEEISVERVSFWDGETNAHETYEFGCMNMPVESVIAALQKVQAILATKGLTTIVAEPTGDGAGLTVTGSRYKTPAEAEAFRQRQADYKAGRERWPSPDASDELRATRRAAVAAEIAARG
jgi:hypothetical protein